MSVDYLLGRTEGERPSVADGGLSAEERRFLNLFRSLGKTGKSRVIEYAEFWVDGGK